MYIDCTASKVLAIVHDDYNSGTLTVVDADGSKRWAVQTTGEVIALDDEYVVLRVDSGDNIAVLSADTGKVVTSNDNPSGAPPKMVGLTGHHSVALISQLDDDSNAELYLSGI